MLLHHHSIDSLSVTESQKPKAAGASSGAIPHDSALLNLTELREIVTKGL